MRRKNIPPYDEEEQKLQMQSTAIVDFLRRKGAVPDTSINDEAVRKAHKDRAQRLYQNTEVLLNQYRVIVWVLECIPGEMAAELLIPLREVDLLVEKLDMEMTLENKRVESRVNAMMKTRYLVDRIHEACILVYGRYGFGGYAVSAAGDGGYDLGPFLYDPSGHLWSGRGHQHHCCSYGRRYCTADPDDLQKPACSGRSNPVA